MANIKKITLDWSETGKTLYAIIRREADSYRLNDADGAFASNPADPYLSLAEDSVMKGRYEVSESRQAWDDGRYTFAVYKQAGGSPAPASDTIIGTGEMYIVGDSEIILDESVATRASQTSVDAIPTTPLLAADYVAPDNAGIAAIKAKTDTIIWTDITRLLGLTLENHVEDDIVRDGKGNKVSSVLYLYDSASNASTHDKSTGLVASYNVSAVYSGGKMTAFKVIKAAE